jgi:hypothetical protein
MLAWTLIARPNQGSGMTSVGMPMTSVGAIALSVAMTTASGVTA